MILQDKVVLVTGGTGSMGKVFVRRVLTGEMGLPKKIIILSRDEAKQHEMRISYLNKSVVTDEVIYNNFKNLLDFRIGDVRNYSDVCGAVRRADIVINAAALKQVPSCEYFPEQAILTNCMGAANIVRAISENDYPVQTVVGISTDKACKPVNVMGMTKSLQERIFTSANVLNPKTRFICVRYGNVLASRGSVIPLFHDQIEKGGPVTLTVPTMTRFLLTLNQAVDTVFAALKEALPGETYVPDAPSATVENIARALVGDRKIEMKITGMRPGEKMHEIMVSEEEFGRVIKRSGWYVIPPMLPELAASTTGPTGTGVLTAEFSSGDRPMDLAGTQALLKKHGLMVGSWDKKSDGEMLA